ncbi:MAG: hypothetical protein ACYDBW_13085 [Sulfuricaulis sp.]
MKLFVDRIHRLPRIWSNRELEKFAHVFGGDIVNVSGWQDIDKEGRHYKDYFINAKSYTITNFKSEARGFQGYDNEIFLDLELDLPANLHRRFDLVFNHTTLEHIYSVHKAFSNLCDLSRDTVILILPFLQQYHSTYGDYWRFTPLAIKKMFEDKGFTLLYQSFNSHKRSSVYTFTIASRTPEKWRDRFEWSFSCVDTKGGGSEPYIGCRAIPNWGNRLRRLFKR